MEKKVCTKCGENKSVEEFYKRRIGSKIGPHAQCKTCMKEMNQAYRTQNPDKIREKRKRYSEEDKEKQRLKTWRSENSSYFRDYRRRKMKGEDGISYPALGRANQRSEVTSL